MGIEAIRYIKAFIPADTLKTVYKCLIQLFFYCSPLWDKCSKLLQDKQDKLQQFQVEYMQSEM